MKYRTLNYKINILDLPCIEGREPQFLGIKATCMMSKRFPCKNIYRKTFHSSPDTSRCWQKTKFEFLIFVFQVNVVVNEGESLGLMIRGGKEFGLGIYITGIDTYSVADHAGLKVSQHFLYAEGLKGKLAIKVDK